MLVLATFRSLCLIPGHVPSWCGDFWPHLSHPTHRRNQVERSAPSKAPQNILSLKKHGTLNINEHCWSASNLSVCIFQQIHRCRYGLIWMYRMYIHLCWRNCHFGIQFVCSNSVWTAAQDEAKAPEDRFDSIEKQCDRPRIRCWFLYWFDIDRHI